MLIRLALAGRLKGYVENGFHRSDDENAESTTELDPMAMALLFAADRRDHIAAEIEPNLRKGRTVISDRYLLSTLAYQGIQGMDTDWLMSINAQAIRPDLTIFLDVDVERARTRIQGTRWREDIYESVHQQKRVREMYHEIIGRNYPILGTILRIDAGRQKEVVRDHVLQILTQFFETGTIAEEPHAELGLFGSARR
jgi:dTMP kinase